MLNTSRIIEKISTIEETRFLSKTEEKANFIAEQIARQHIIIFRDSRNGEIVRLSPYQIRQWESGATFVVGVRHIEKGKGRTESYPIGVMFDLRSTTDYFHAKKQLEIPASLSKSKVLAAVALNEPAHRDASH